MKTAIKTADAAPVYKGWSAADDYVKNNIAEQVVLPVIPKECYIENIGDVAPRRFYESVKRVFDIFASFLALVILFIPTLIIALIIKCDDPTGSVLYRQGRVGKNGKEFTIYKFRSMRSDAENSGAQWASEDDPRITRVGSFLRKTRLDEIPQFFNILKGDMSFVGPRPERLVFYVEFEKYIHGFSQRTKIIPGLTGLAQISGGYDLGPEDKIIFDIDYIKNRSLLFDLKIIFKTIAIVFSHDGAR